MEKNFRSMPRRTGAASGGAVLACLADSLGYRYYWATENMPAAALNFRPTPESMDLRGLLQHLRDLAWWLRTTLTGDRASRGASEFDELRQSTMEWLDEVSTRLAELDSAALDALRIRSSRGGEPQPVWNMIHGPFADFLTHVGQVNSWRRMAGSPAPEARVFLGLPPVPNEDVRPERSAAQPHRVIDADLSEAEYRDVTLTGASFVDVSLAGAKFRDVTFAGATLQDVDLSNVSITDANVDGLRIEGQLYTLLRDGAS